MSTHQNDAGRQSRRLSKRRLPFFNSRARSPGLESTFSASQILPRSTSAFQPNVASAFDPPPELPIMPPTRPGSISPAPASVFEPVEEEEYQTEPTTAPNSGSGDEREHYDLKPPPPSVSHTNMEALSTRFFSSDHLNVILRDYQQAARFSKFISQYKPYALPSLESYMDTQKAVAAIEYANALADNLPSLTGDIPRPAATIDEQFHKKSQVVVQELVDDALPGFLTQNLVHLVTDALVKEITGNNAPIMREMIPSLAEVYCVTDPSLPDNPIVYASEEFYNTTQYGKEYVIGRNCRFLQGPKSSIASINRLIEALRAGQEITETILNYRRDGTPFMNLLMIAPLYDNKGTVRYFLGCQIDVSHLVEGGKGFDTFEKLLSNDRAEERFRGRTFKKPAQVLSELGQMMNNEEMDAINKRPRSESRGSNPAITPLGSIRGGSVPRAARKILGMDDPNERGLWPHPSLGPSGRLPGVYQNYLLVRPYPSLRITFTSPALRIPGLLQTKLLDRIGGPQHIRDGVLDSLAHGSAVTAKVSWLSSNDPNRSSVEGKPRWLHCTPLLGSDEKVGVWMIVMVESETVTGTLRRASEATQMNAQTAAGGGPAHSVPSSPVNASSPRFASNANKLYAEYLRREGKSPTPPQINIPSRGSSARAIAERAVHEPAPFQDF